MTKVKVALAGRRYCRNAGLPNASVKLEGGVVRYSVWIIGLAAGTLVAVALSGLAVDDPFRVHMGILSLVLGLATIVAMRLPQPAAAEPVSS